jgi:hypothetical protein
MKAIDCGEILSLSDYERVRPRLRPLFIAEKDRRRLRVGEHLTFLFENGRTAWYQIQEMLRSEKITSPEAIQQEIDTYNELIPAPKSLSAMMLIEYESAAERDAALCRLVGIERHVWLELGGNRLGARFDPRQISAEQVSAVQFVRFPLGGVEAEDLERLAAEGRAAALVDHQALAARAPLGVELARALADDVRSQY